jgi:hypothetical protein
MCEGSGISSMAVAQLARDAGPMPAPMTIPQSAKRMEQNAPQMGFGERIHSCCAGLLSVWRMQSSNTMCSVSTDRWRTSVILFGLFFINFELVCGRDPGRPGFIFGNKRVNSGVNLSEAQLAHWIFFFM